MQRGESGLRIRNGRIDPLPESHRMLHLEAKKAAKLTPAYLQCGTLLTNTSKYGKFPPVRLFLNYVPVNFDRHTSWS